MQNQAAVEALYSATFVEDYMDYVENVPDDLQRNHTRLRELDMLQHQDVLSELEGLMTQFENESTDPIAQKRLLNKMIFPLITSQDIGDEKIQLVQALADTIENKTRQLEHDSQNLDFGGKSGENEIGGSGSKVSGNSSGKGVGAGGGATGKVKEEKSDKSASKRRKVKEDDRGEEPTIAGKSGGAGGGGKSGVGKKGGSGSGAAGGGASKQSSGGGASSSKKKGGGGGGKKGSTAAAEQPAERNNSPPAELANVDIDPDEPTYCLCDQVSYGEMIGCDNDLCPIEWFHFNCVQLNGKPKGKWFCPKCRGDKATVMKPKAQFLKELEKFNKEKEDKAK